MKKQWFRLRLFHKVFLALLLLSSLLVAMMAIVVQWNFRHGFNDYLHQVELEKLASLQQQLVTFYAENGDWSLLQQDHLLWQQLISQSLAVDHATAPNTFIEPPAFHHPMPFGPPMGPWGPAPEAHFPPPLDQREVSQLIPRLRLLDADEKLVSGSVLAALNETRVPLRHEQQLIGWLTLSQDEMITDQLSLQFQQQQSKMIVWIALFAVLLAVMGTSLLTRQLLKPINRLALGAKALISGQYQTRISVTGTDELSQLATDFNRLAQTLAQNEQSQQQWLADVSHELRTPLSLLQAKMEALQDGVRQMTVDYLHSLHADVLILSKLVEDLYQLALSDLGALDYRKESVVLNELIAELLSAFALRFAAKHIQLDGKSSQIDKVILLADPKRLRQLLTNLLENSLRYTDEDGRLLVRLSVSADKAEILLEDSPPAVPEQALPQLFDRLYRVDKSRSRRFGGAGLGLAICHNIVTAHQGKITAYHSPLGGLGIQIQLPLR